MSRDAFVSAHVADLRARLDRVRGARDDETFRVATGSEPVDALVGMTRDAIRAALGEPERCDDLRDARGRVQLFAPCTRPSDWFYSFFHLPRGMRGGGPHLLLSFSAQGTCTAARWQFTR